MQSKKNTRAAHMGSGGEQARRPLLTILKAVTLGLLVTMVLLLLFSFLFCRQDLPLTLLNPLAAFSLLMGTFAAGYWASRSIGQRGMLTGASCGAALFLVLLIASLQTKAQVDLTALIKLAISRLSGHRRSNGGEPPARLFENQTKTQRSGKIKFLNKGANQDV